ncbi:hypothetical protein BDV34DRAFT_235388, partial [Aspergillus parasiticus]
MIFSGERRRWKRMGGRQNFLEGKKLEKLTTEAFRHINTLPLNFRSFSHTPGPPSVLVRCWEKALLRVYPYLSTHILCCPGMPLTDRVRSGGGQGRIPVVQPMISAAGWPRRSADGAGYAVDESPLWFCETGIHLKLHPDPLVSTPIAMAIPFVGPNFCPSVLSYRIQIPYGVSYPHLPSNSCPATREKEKATVCFHQGGQQKKKRARSNRREFSPAVDPCIHGWVRWTGSDPHGAPQSTNVSLQPA